MARREGFRRGFQAEFGVSGLGEEIGEAVKEAVAVISAAWRNMDARPSWEDFADNVFAEGLKMGIGIRILEDDEFDFAFTAIENVVDAATGESEVWTYPPLPRSRLAASESWVSYGGASPF
ncbi:hypothetical protein ACFOE1_05160 [Agromyces mediolanus]|uniref:Uncharacterized protein n=1 Tax=Agromyces mediolanus TaxID=41986 RepID=A0A918CLG9_AGRME|nr:hypothetical protein [Agromyces mediolanus]GGR28964.1 hypothetical protein GCM10010196_23540 [Agromyces mediolanus]GLJ72150.1 hypothetical protein GCM10017583_14060 [Agromyces mediolanus]